MNVSSDSFQVRGDIEGICIHLRDPCGRGIRQIRGAGEGPRPSKRAHALLLDATERRSSQYAFKTPFATYEWYEQPGNEGRLACFSAAMTGGAASQRPDAIVEGMSMPGVPQYSVFTLTAFI